MRPRLRRSLELSISTTTTSRGRIEKQNKLVTLQTFKLFYFKFLLLDLSLFTSRILTERVDCYYKSVHNDLTNTLIRNIIELSSYETRCQKLNALPKPLDDI